MLADALYSRDSRCQLEVVGGERVSALFFLRRNRRSPRARASPSKVEVPRPISSSHRMDAVALCRSWLRSSQHEGGAAAREVVRSTYARVNLVRSDRAQSFAGTKQPVCARSAMQRTWRCRWTCRPCSGRSPSSSWRAAERRQSLAMKGSTSDSTTGCRGGFESTCFGNEGRPRIIFSGRDEGKTGPHSQLRGAKANALQDSDVGPPVV